MSNERPAIFAKRASTKTSKTNLGAKTVCMANTKTKTANPKDANPIAWLDLLSIWLKRRALPAQPVNTKIKTKRPVVASPIANVVFTSTVPKQIVLHVALDLPM